MSKFVEYYPSIFPLGRACIGLPPHSAWHSFSIISFVALVLPSTTLLRIGTCGTMTDVQSDAASIRTLTLCKDYPTLRIDSLNASDARSIARPDLTCVIVRVSEEAISIF